MPDFNKFTNYSQELLNSAGAIMQSHKNSEMQPEHIMLAMIKDRGAIKDYLTELKLLNQGFIDKIVSVIKSFPTKTNLTLFVVTGCIDSTNISCGTLKVQVLGAKMSVISGWP